MKMRHHLLVLIFLTVVVNGVFAQEITGFVNDYANVLGSQKQGIEQISQQLYNAGLAQVAVVTINSLEGKPIEDAAFKLAEGKLGAKDKNNGLLLLIAVEDREYRFEVGRGLEPIFNDAKVGRYGRELLVPALQKGEYGEGVLQVMKEIQNTLTGKDAAGNTTDISLQATSKNLNMKIAIIFFVFLLAFFALLHHIKKSTKNLGLRKGKMGDDRYFWAALIASRMMRGGGGFGGGGGGFGGFGGGSFGGGGAGSKW